MNFEKISDMGILSDVVYSAIGGNFLFVDNVINGSEDGVYLLGSSYTVIDYADTFTGMQAVLFEKNDVNGTGNKWGQGKLSDVKIMEF